VEQAEQKKRSETRSSAIAEELHNVLCQLKSCQLLHSCTKKSHLKKLAVHE